MGRERVDHDGSSKTASEGWRVEAHAALDVVLDRLELRGFGSVTHGFDLVGADGKPLRGVILVRVPDDHDTGAPA